MDPDLAGLTLWLERWSRVQFWSRVGTLVAHLIPDPSRGVREVTNQCVPFISMFLSLSLSPSLPFCQKKSMEKYSQVRINKNKKELTVVS